MLVILVMPAKSFLERRSTFAKKQPAATDLDLKVAEYSCLAYSCLDTTLNVWMSFLYISTVPCDPLKTTSLVPLICFR